MPETKFFSERNDSTHIVLADSDPYRSPMSQLIAHIFLTENFLWVQDCHIMGSNIPTIPEFIKYAY